MVVKTAVEIAVLFWPNWKAFWISLGPGKKKGPRLPSKYHRRLSPVIELRYNTLMFLKGVFF